jgi:hypothetical protein
MPLMMSLHNLSNELWHVFAKENQDSDRHANDGEDIEPTILAHGVPVDRICGRDGTGFRVRRALSTTGSCQSYIANHRNYLLSHSRASLDVSDRIFGK